MRQIYLDHAAATPLDPQVKKAMEPYFTKEFGNPSSLHRYGVQARKALEVARERVAEVLHVPSRTIVFTSSGTESDNLALLGVARANQDKGRHIIISSIEHPAIHEATAQLEREHFIVSRIGVDRFGLVDPQAIAQELRPETILVSVMYANNEVGTIQPIREIAKVLRRWRTKSGHAWPYFHTDAAQAAGYLELGIAKLGVDLLSLNGSKLYGPKGSGLLYIGDGIAVQPLMFGGGQEGGVRAGTENLAGTVGLAEALGMSQKLALKETKRLTALRDRLIVKLLKAIAGSVLNGHPTLRLPNNVNVSLPGVEGETVVLYLNAKGVAASTGSACAALDREPSRVLQALNLTADQVAGSVRFTLGRSTKREDIDEVVGILQDILKKVRA